MKKLKILKLNLSKKIYWRGDVPSSADVLKPNHSEFFLQFLGQVLKVFAGHNHETGAAEVVKNGGTFIAPHVSFKAVVDPSKIVDLIPVIYYLERCFIHKRFLLKLFCCHPKEVMPKEDANVSYSHYSTSYIKMQIIEL